MYIDVITCKECIHYKLYARPDVYECSLWGRIVGASAYCSRAEKGYQCRTCEHCRSLMDVQNEDKKDFDLKYLCVRERVAYNTDPTYSCSYYEKREDINNEEVDC